MTLWLLAACVKPVALPAPPPSAPSEVRPVRISHVAREHVMRAYMQQESGQLEEAAASWKRAILFDPESAELYLRLGSVREQLGEIDAARSWYEEAAARGSEEAVQRMQALDRDLG